MKSLRSNFQLVVLVANANTSRHGSVNLPEAFMPTIPTNGLTIQDFQITSLHVDNTFPTRECLYITRTRTSQLFYQSPGFSEDPNTIEADINAKDKLTIKKTWDVNDNDFRAMATKNPSLGKKRLAMSLAFVTAWADITLLYKYKVFTTMMTGNTLLLASAVAEKNIANLCYYLCIISSYLVGSVCSRQFDATNYGNDSSSSIRVPAFVTVVTFIASDVTLAFTSSKGMAVCLLAFGFGVVNTISQKVTGTLTNVITGAMTKLTNHFVSRLTVTMGKESRLTPQQKDMVLQSSGVLGGFFVGAVWGCFLLRRLSYLRHGMIIGDLGEVTTGVFSLIGTSLGLLFLWHDANMWTKVKLFREKDVIYIDDDKGSLHSAPTNPVPL